MLVDLRKVCKIIHILYVTGSAKRGLIAFLNFQLQLVKTHSVFSLLCKIGHRNRTMLGVQGD